MNVLELKQQISSNNLNKFYIFTGEEWKIQQIYIRQLVSMSGKIYEYTDTILDVTTSLNSGNSLFKKSKIYVVRDDKEFVQNENTWKILNILEDNILIYLATTLDKRSRFYKQFKDNIVEFEKLPIDTLIRYCKQKINLSTENARLLVNLCEFDYGRMELEIDKLLQYQSNDYNKTLYQFINNGVIYIPSEDAVFKLIDCLFKKDYPLMYHYYQDCKEIGESNLVILSNIFNTAKRVLQIQTCKGTNVSHETGLDERKIYAIQNKCGIYSNNELKRIMRITQETELNIKAGLIDDKISVDYVLAMICTKGE